MAKSLGFSLDVMGSHWMVGAGKRHNLVVEAGRQVRREIFNQEEMVVA